MSEKLELLKHLEVGERVAEDEADDLEKYFVETDQWQQIYAGKIDVVYGPKGSGKSALYTLLSKKETALFDAGVLVASAENVMGATVFRALVVDPPPSEFSFIYLWKLYCLVLAGRTLRDYDIANQESKSLISALEKTGLLPARATLSAFFSAASDYLKNWMNRDVEAVVHELTIDPESGMPNIKRKAQFREASEEQNLNDIPVDELFEIANLALEKESLKLWLIFDRLDVAFAGSPELERNALRALFRAYSDLKGLSQLTLKIFVRDDLWRRITEGGFTEASHIVRTTDISWSSDGLLNLIVRRLLSNQGLVEYTHVDVEEIKSNADKQSDFFYTLLPGKVDTGKNPDTFDWIVSRTADSSGSSVPREIIHLLEVAKELQIKKLERGGNEPEGSELIERSSLKEALPVVSKIRFEQTLLAEYPDMQSPLQQLEGEKCEHSIRTLSRIWNTDEETAANNARRLVEIGFFEERGTKDDPSYWVPFLYRGALNLVMGRAET